MFYTEKSITYKIHLLAGTCMSLSWHQFTLYYYVADKKRVITLKLQEKMNEYGYILYYQFSPASRDKYLL